jgi:release factor glutamine methyltransferase
MDDVLPASDRSPHLGAWRDQAVDALRAAARSCPEATVEFWIAHVLGGGRGIVRLRAAHPLPPEIQARLDAGLARLRTGAPLQYVTGETEFLGRRFRCDRRALIPRPETEDLAARVVEAWRGVAAERPLDLVDVGTGTGCLAITLALELPGAQVTGIDLSAEALALARENAASLRAPVRWRCGDLLEGIAPASLDGVIANPPYVSDVEWAGLDPGVRDHEPRLALAAGPTGLEVYTRLLPQALAALRPGGRLWLEIGDRQGESLLPLAEAAGAVDVRVLPDLSGRSRFLFARKPPLPDSGG